MTNRTLGDEIVTIAQTEIKKLPYNQTGTITHSYTDGYSDIKLEDGSTLKYIQTIGDNSTDNTGIIVYQNKDYQYPVFISDNNRINELNTIRALNIGIFHINDNGHLIVELPMNIQNFFHIGDDGHLYVTLLDDLTDNPYTINTDGHLIYTGGE